MYFMKKLNFTCIILLSQLMLNCSNLFAQNDTFTISNSSSSKNICIPRVFDTNFIVLNDTFMQAEIFEIKKNKKVLFQRCWLYRSESINSNRIYMHLYDGNSDCLNTIHPGYRLFLNPFYQTGTIIGYDSLGNLMYKILLKNGYLHGKWVQYYSNKNVLATGVYHNNCRDSTWLFYYDNGKLLKKGNYFPKVYSVDFKRTDENKYIFCTYGCKNKLLHVFSRRRKLRKDLLINTKYIGRVVLPTVFYYRTGVWEIYSKDGILLKKRKFKTSSYDLTAFDILPLKK
jgi:hypothetical protein